MSRKFTQGIVNELKQKIYESVTLGTSQQKTKTASPFGENYKFEKNVLLSNNYFLGVLFT